MPKWGGRSQADANPPPSRRSRLIIFRFEVEILALSGEIVSSIRLELGVVAIFVTNLVEDRVVRFEEGSTKDHLVGWVIGIIFEGNRELIKRPQFDCVGQDAPTIRPRHVPSVRLRRQNGVRGFFTGRVRVGHLLVEYFSDNGLQRERVRFSRPKLTLNSPPFSPKSQGIIQYPFFMRRASGIWIPGDKRL